MSELCLHTRQNPAEYLHQTLKRHMRKSGKTSISCALRAAVVRATINAPTGKTLGDLFLRGGYSTPLRSLQPHHADDNDMNTDDEVQQLR